MARILKTIWLDLRFCLRAIKRWPRPQPADNSNATAGDPSTAPSKRFYSLIVEVRPDDASAEILLLFSAEACISLATTLNLPAGCELRRCTPVSPDFAEILIHM